MSDTDYLADPRVQKTLALIADDKSLRKACQETGLVPSTFLLWCLNDSTLAEHYARARDMGADIGFDQLKDEAEGAEQAVREIDDPKRANALVSAIKLRCDTIKWRIARQKPRAYSERLDITSGGEKLETPQVWKIGGKEIEFK